MRYDLDEAEIKPYFPLERMVGAAFDCAARCSGCASSPRPDIAGYHPDVEVYEVRNAAGAIGLFLHDNFARPNKRSGAWMSASACSRGTDPASGAVLPIIVDNNNFAKGAEGEPTLLGSTMRARCSTSSGTACTGCCPT